MGCACFADGGAELARTGARPGGAAGGAAAGFGSSVLGDGDGVGSEWSVVTTRCVHTAGFALPVVTKAVRAIIPATLTMRATGAKRHPPTRGGAVA